MMELDLFILLIDQMQSCQDWQMEANECFKLMIDIIEDYQNRAELISA